MRDPSQTLSIKKLKGIYFKAFLTSSPYSGINGTKLVAIGMINIRKTPIENTKEELFTNKVIRNKNRRTKIIGCIFLKFFQPLHFL